MQEILEQIFGYLKGIWNKRWYAMGIAWIICIAGWGYVYNMPNQYQSTGKLYIDTQSLLRPLLRGLAIQTNVEQQVRLMVKTLLTRPNVIKIINIADLDLYVEGDQAMNGLIKSLQGKIKITKTGRENLYDISVHHTDPEIAQRIVQATLTVFVENTLGEGREESDSAKKFIDKQIKEYEKRLVKAERKLTEFKQTNYEMLSSGQGYYSQMKSAQSQLEQAKLELKEAIENKIALEEELEDIEDDIESYDLIPSPTSGPAIASSYDARIVTLEADIDNYLISYTEKHPDVISAKRLLERLTAKRSSEIAAYKSSKKSNEDVISADVGNNPVYQQLKISLSQASAVVQTLNVRIIEYEARYEKMKKLVNTVPEIDAKLVALNRDYNVTKDQYNKFLQKRESASISRSVDQTTDSVQFRIIEQPRVIDKPVGPKRILFSSLVLLVSLGAGMGVSFLLSQLKPVFNSVHAISQVTSYPVLGTVSAISSPAQKQRRMMMALSFFLLLMALVAVYSALMAWYYF